MGWCIARDVPTPCGVISRSWDAEKRRTPANGGESGVRLHGHTGDHGRTRASTDARRDTEGQWPPLTVFVVAGRVPDVRGLILIALGVASLLGGCPEEEAPREREVLRVRGPRIVHYRGGPSDFWMFRGGPHHRGLVDARGPRAPRLAWKAKTGGEIWAQPVIGHDGTVYVGSFDHRFYAITSSGRIKWSVDLGDLIYSTALLARGGRIYVGSDDDRFYCLSRRGKVRWSLRTSEVERPTSAFDADTSPAPGPDGSVYFASGPHVYRVGDDGAVLWRYSVGDKVFSSPAVDENGTVYFGAQDGHLYALDPTGEVRFRVALGADIDSSPVITASGSIVVGLDRGSVVSVSSSGDVRWRSKVGGHVRASPAVSSDGKILVSTFGPDPRLVALDESNGREVWSRPLDRGRRPADFGSHSSPVIDGLGVAYVGSSKGRVHAFDVDDGSLRWTFPTGGWIESSPALGGDGLLYIGSAAGVLYALTESRVHSP